MNKNLNYSSIFLLTLLVAITLNVSAIDISDKTFLISKIGSQNLKNKQTWELLQNDDATGIEIEVFAKNKDVFLQSSSDKFATVLEIINSIIQETPSKIVPVFIKYDDNILLLDSIINESEISSYIFYLPQGETWPSEEYLVQANRRVIFFIDGNFSNESRILHHIENYAFEISANMAANSLYNSNNLEKINQELFVINDFDKIPSKIPRNLLNSNLVPDYINFLLENWKKYGKRPNFIFVGNEIFNFDFIVDQLNSFTWIKGVAKISDKNLEKLYWKNPDIMVTGGKFSFPYRGGEELILTPFVPGFKMTPQQIVATGEMTIPESYNIFASPLKLSEDLTGSFNFEGIVMNSINSSQTFEGNNFSFVQDIERGNVLRLPENASINLGKPEIYGFRNSSFTVSCFVKFTEILEFGDNAILGNYESGYRRGLHLILRSGHPYFGLWANDFVAEKILQSNTWYHLTWRYIVETGEQSIFLNGQFIGGSDGHPPFSGTGDIHLGSALSSGASLRGYIDNLLIWNRPLGNEEINRLSLDEEIQFEEITSKYNGFLQLSKNWTLLLGGLIIISILIFLVTKRYTRRKSETANDLPSEFIKNNIQLFGEFKVIDNSGEDITDLFTPKIKELFLFTLIYTFKSGIGANIKEINDVLWPGLSSKKVDNNRSVTLNKLRKILQQIDGIEIISNNGFLQAKIKKPFYCDYIRAHKLCQIPEGLSKQQLISFYEMVKKGRFLKGAHWPWLDEVRGFTGNQVIDNLLKLASIYQKEVNLSGIEKIAQRILDYDDLSEEAIYLQIWALQKANNSYLAKFNFKSFSKKYEDNFGEPYAMDFSTFVENFENKF
ncbi:MAG TPA: LamG-like jellyroll fold domain-containing protein [Draconibacterium sp.]|nr:LamG-like jellyroll fold domain-containing protein [Draconibacterium sp.]